jgi:hypothetical protein
MVAFLLSSYAIYQLMARIIFVIAHFNATQQKKNRSDAAGTITN